MDDIDIKSRNIFIYWVGKEYKFIKILRSLIFLHSTNGKGYNVHFLTNKNINKYINYIPEYFNKLIPAHQADFVRVCMVCDYGGIYLDSDTLVIDSLDSLFDILDEKEGFLIKHFSLGNAVFGSNKETKFMKTWKKLLLLKVNKEKEKMGWPDVGAIMLENLYKNHIDLFKNYKIFNGQDNLYPVKYYNCIPEYLTKPFNNYKNVIRDYQPLIVLTNRVYISLEKETKEDILNGTKPINYFINKSYDNFNKNKFNIEFKTFKKKTLKKNMKFIGQKGQDEWIIDTIFNYKTHGYFVDLAATDGIAINNTLLLERELNWDGICIEPNPKYYDKLKKNRNCNVTDFVVDKANNIEIKFRIDNGELGGIVDIDTDNNEKFRSNELKNATILKLKTKTLEYVLDKFNAPKVIDYLSLDVEGAEERILTNFPFNRYTFLAMTIERPTPELEKVLFDNGYVFVMVSKKLPFDTFYVHKTIPNFDQIIKEPYTSTPRKDW
tara:strand:- start:148 stop:1626 length:1479 start_codon:yes stop_codon:yes gene_type:complete